MILYCVTSTHTLVLYIVLLFACMFSCGQEGLCFDHVLSIWQAGACIWGRYIKLSGLIGQGKQRILQVVWLGEELECGTL